MDINKVIKNKRTKILIVGGTFDMNDGRPSGLVEKVINRFKMNASDYNAEIFDFNGGNYNDLVKIQENFLPNVDIVLWWANVPNDLPKLRDVKAVNYKVISVISKRNDNNKYTLQDILQRTLEQKGNLCVIFEKLEENKFNFSLIDPLGNIYYSGTHVDPFVSGILRRGIFLSSISRAKTINAGDKDSLKWYYDLLNRGSIYDKEMHHVFIAGDSTLIKDKEEKEAFLNIVKEYAEILTKTIFNVKEQLEIKRFLGNASFRCNKGFPSFRDGDYIFVSRRNVDKTHISINEFVPTYLKDNEVYYLGENKPSVDTPVQLRLYNKLPNIKYMLHSHVYIKDAPTINSLLPCGALEEADEILNYIETTSEGFNISHLAINLKGHGCLIMSSDVEYFNAVKDRIVARPKPEKQYYTFEDEVRRGNV